ncbi:filamentous hemagglutinin N-terminal domain-containing protein [Candidatus Halobeggiatoa sp. HSG11]|nr:filamentous hemagglutinin N-terminal domain-containing protein [Candidatus Halobeggiatoa sp. HSG11]
MFKKSFVFLLLICNLSNAEVITDGTLGQHINLPGSDFQIEANLGQQHGGNLFHSFQDFNLNSSESATFSGPNSVQNILSRVTGGNSSNIDGLIHSTIPNADMYFLNPYGIMFGPNAKLDIQGSFHASTADYLKLGENGRFDARYPNDSLLTVAPIESFGFLSDSPASITINNSYLSVPTQQTISLIGGDLTFDKTILSTSSGQINLEGNITISNNSLLDTSGDGGGNVFIRAGQFVMDNSNIYARTQGTQNGGIIDIQANNIELTNLSKITGGTENIGDGTDIKLVATESIRLINNSPLNTDSGDMSKLDQQLGTAGHIKLQAKNIEINNVYIANGMFSTNNYGTGRGGNINLSAENNLNVLNDSAIVAGTWGTDTFAGDGGNIHLKASNINQKASSIHTESHGNSDTGQIKITTGQLYMGKVTADGSSSWLQTSAQDQGNSNKITIQADNIKLEDGAVISTGTVGKGNAGDIDIQVDNQLIVRGASGLYGLAAGITANSTAIFENTQTGNAANIHIQAQDIKLENGGRIDTSSRAYFPTAISGQAGNIMLEVDGKLILTGVNHYGENYQNFGSVISSRSMGNAGDAGNIQIHAGSVAVLDGALIETGSNSESYGGNIQVQANENIIINGDSSQISLSDPAWSQYTFLTLFNPPVYNQSTSGIYSHSNSSYMNSGNSGQIELSTPQLTLSNKGQISTANQGGGEAGTITLNVQKLILSDNAVIRSNSDLVNQFSFASIAERDNRLIDTGTVVKTLDIGEGKAVYQINLGNTLVNFMPIIHAANIAEREQIAQQVQLSYLYGDIVIVKDAGNGQPARFVYVYSDAINETWIKVDESNKVVLEQLDFSTNIVDFIDNAQPPFKNGTQIHVKDVGNGKAADFVYTIITPVGSGSNIVWGQAYQVRYYQVADTVALQNLANSTDLVVGTQVDVGSDGTRFVFDGNDWVKFGTVLEVADVPAREKLVLAQPGHIAQINNAQTTIYTGSQWIPVNNETEHVQVQNMQELNILPAKNGDIVGVRDAGEGNYEHFFYSDGKWIKQIRGGNAGQIIINADEIQLNNGSEIATASVSGGGGSIKINADGLVFLHKSQLSTSVQEGIGNGGDSNIAEPQFMVMNQGKIIAQANEGHGGNIHIKSGQFITSPDSLISASSKLGIDGEIAIEAIDINMEGFLVVLSDEVVEASSLMKRPCSMRGSSFFVKKINGSPQTPYDYHPSTYLPETDSKIKTVSKNSGEKLAFSTCKK